MDFDFENPRILLRAHEQGRFDTREALAILSTSIFIQSQIAIEEKESILGSIPEDFKERGSLLYTTLIDGKIIGCL
ncbi:uncharacterized protein A4U43_C07F26300 [Asparagus officinalis]|uniref:Uncharacterized protein n=1 Tax=Asparagus officinalis TaxID=4686 RepID=A0A5P1EFA9_ASPOF|nr:uncharacterized protein A4U43_C07F26300 [Asparagus officinalis]